MRPPFVVLAAVLACSHEAPRSEPPAVPVPASAPTETAVREPNYLVEARRSSAELIARSSGPEAAGAIRGLGRVGDAAAIGRLLALVRGGEAAERVEAVRALGMAALLGSEIGEAEAVLIERWGAASEAEQVAIAEALGRLGGAASLPVLTEGLRSASAEVKVAAAIAFGVLGRREVGPPAAIEAELAKMLAAPELAYAGLYALAQRREAWGVRVPAAALASAEARRLWVAGRAREIQDPSAACVVRASPSRAGDEAWLKGMREKGTEWMQGEREAGDIAEVLARYTCVAEAQRSRLDAGWAAAIARLRAQVVGEGKVGARLDCQLARLSAHQPGWRAPLVCVDSTEAAALEAGVLADGFGGAWAVREGRLRSLLEHADPRVRIAAVTAVGRLWGEQRALAEGALRAALADPVLGVVGAAGDAIAKIYREEPRPAPARAEDALWQALAERSGRALAEEPELYASLSGALAAMRAPEGAKQCEAGLGHANPSVRAAARTCVKELRGAEPAAVEAAAAVLPPIDPSRVVGKRVRWELTTEQGTLRVELDPEVAPWAVAMLVTLSERGFYDGLTFHREVPGFVLQGGDPEGTGWGGPGFALPSEPSNRRYVRGAVGIADAGKDTGGSQFFLMLGPAPHLEGRYTWVGQLAAEDLAVLDKLGLGDKIVRARAVIEPR